MTKIDRQVKATRKYRERKRDIGKPGRPPKSSAQARGPFVAPADDDPEAWLLAYLPRAFPLPFGQVHRDIIREFVHALATGGNAAIGAPRGTGKSTLVNALALWALLTGRTSFPVIVPWSDKSRRQALRFWSGELCFNARLAEKYEDACRPFVACKGVAQRLASLTEHGEATGARLGLSEGVIVLPGDLGAIGSATINGNPRGMNYSTHTGEIRRPTLAIIDDPQDRKTAASPARVQETIERVDGDVAGMAGPDSRMSMVMCCTVIQPDDVAEHYLSDPDWRAVRVGQVATWPAGWTEQPSATRALWDEWNRVRIEGETEHDGGAAALVWYAERREAMTAGMTVTWSERYDAKRGQPDALYAAMYDFYKMGESAFMAERQNEPVKNTVSQYAITPQLVASRVNGHPRLTAPGAVDWITAGADVNYRGINWCILAGTRAGVLYAVAYGCYTGGKSALFDPKTQPKQHEAAAIAGGILAWMRDMNALQVICEGKPMHVTMGTIDCGDWTDVIVPTIYSVRQPTQYIPIRGVSAQKYRPAKDALKVGDGWNMARWRQGRVLVINSDLYKETVQRAFLAEPGTPGSISLHAVDHASQHGDFADEVCGENLAERVQTPTSDFYRWTHRPGARWDKLDALAYARASLAVCGLTASGEVTARPVQRPIGRRIRHVKV